MWLGGGRILRMKFFLLLLLLGLGVVVVVEVLRGRRGWKVAALLLLVVLVLRVVMMDVSLVLFWEDLLRFRRCLKMMKKKKKKKRPKRLVCGRISIDWSLREGAVDSFEKGPITIFSARLALVASFLLFDFLRRHHWTCVGGNRWEESRLVEDGGVVCWLLLSWRRDFTSGALLLLGLSYFHFIFSSQRHDIQNQRALVG